MVERFVHFLKDLLKITLRRIFVELRRNTNLCDCEAKLETTHLPDRRKR